MENIKESKLKKRLNWLINFVKNDVWSVDPKDYNVFYRALIYTYKILMLTITDFLKNRCTLWAASITYSTLLSFAPIVAVMLFIARVFSLYDYVFTGMLSIAHEYAPQYEPFIRQIFSFIQTTDISNYGLVGLIATIVSMIFLLMNIQKCLMSIWNIKRTSSLPRLVADYIALIMLLPILIGVSFALVAYSRLAIYMLPAGIRFVLSTIAPIFALWLIILLFYVLIPPTKVLWRGAAISSLITATVIIIIVNIYFKYNIGVDKYKVMFDNQSNYTEYKIESIHNIGTSTNIDDVGVEDVKMISDTNVALINTNISININTNLDLISNKNQNHEQSQNITTNENTASITILITSYTKIDDSDNTKTTQEAVETSSRSMTFDRISDEALEQIIQYDFKIGDMVVITYGNRTLTSIIPQSFSVSGAFVQIPVLLVLVYICYIIVLFGAELNHSYQSMRLYSKDISNYSLSFNEKEAIAFSMLSDIASVFLNKEKQISLNELAEKYKISPEMVTSLLNYFETNGYIISFSGSKGIKYALSASPDDMKMIDLMKGFKKYGGSDRIREMKNSYYFKVIESESEYKNTTLMQHLEKYNK